MPVCGIEKLYVAKQLNDTSAGMTFDTPQYYKNVQELDIKPKINTDKAYGENRLIDQAVAFDSADISLNLYDLTSAQRGYLLGQTTPTGGGTIAASGDTPPFIAVLYKAPLRGGDYRYGVIYKTLFQPPDDTMKGLEGKPDLSQVPKLTGTAQPTEWGFVDGNKTKHPWEYHIDTTDPNCPADIDSTWFNAVTVPGADATPPTVTVTPANAETGIAATSNIVWTFNEAIDSTKVNAANFFLMKGDGTLVPGLLVIDGTNKIVTLNPTSNLLASTAYIAVCTANVTDVAGNPLSNMSITNFTTAA
ncbi:Ig-like domain-containing protein [Desulfosporosinus sp. PR]|uniref:major tail protein n=1 Tax=Candidatus Desulfosporosinus nitrosoreducens TaxID=3401928 RepID=UPI0027E9A3AB|nr:major tail protein [Desulfosporosinus sp. PR]MDQ7095943.1 Ig-like domain-containing protein [Desulfosporosinus sp. PR]